MDLPLLASFAALAVGPLIYRSARAGRSIAAVDAFAMVGVAGLVLVDILPQSFALAGWLVVPVALLGAIGPGAICGSRFFHGRESRRVAMPVALLAIALHAMLDGVAIAADGGNGEVGELALAVVLHRVPEGLLIWWLVLPLYGRRAALGLLAGIAAFSLVGYAFGGALLAAAPREPVALLQALLAGSLLHVILRHPPTATGEEPARRWHVPSALGGLAAVAVVFALGRLHMHGDEGVHAGDGVARGFLDLALESAPALILAYVFVAGAHALLLDLFRLLNRGTAWGQALRGTVVGLPVPVCSCGVIPLYRSLIQGGVPATAAMAFLVATPELEIAAVVLSVSLLGAEITVARLLTAFLLAVLVGRLVGARTRPAPGLEITPPRTGARPPLAARLREGLRYGFGDMVDSTAPWILVGLAIAAAAEPMLDEQAFAALPAALQVPLFALIGMPLYVCASGSTPLVAVLIAKGISPGAAIAFLMTGPATNVTTFGVLARMHGRKTAFLFGATTAALTIACGYAVDAFLPVGAIDLPELHAHDAGVLGWTALIALGAIYLVSLLRQGVRGFLGQVITPHGHGEGSGHACCGPGEPALDAHGHAHGAGACHDHGPARAH